MKDSYNNICILTYSGENQQFDMREDNYVRKQIKQEQIFKQLIINGDYKRVIQNLQQLSSIDIGKMSFNNVIQARYFAVASITLASRWAIQGGLNENVSFNMSDAFIQDIDKKENISEIYQKVNDIWVAFAKEVSKVSRKKQYTRHTRSAIKYIEEHLHSKISLIEMAASVGVSRGYLCKIFKEDVKVTINSYIHSEKMKEALLLLKDYSSKQVGYILGYSSQSHFISTFKNIYGKTPYEYIF